MYFSQYYINFYNTKVTHCKQYNMSKLISVNGSGSNEPVPLNTWVRPIDRSQIQNYEQSSQRWTYTKSGNEKSFPNESQKDISYGRLLKNKAKDLDMSDREYKKFCDEDQFDVIEQKQSRHVQLSNRRRLNMNKVTFDLYKSQLKPEVVEWFNQQSTSKQKTIMKVLNNGPD